MSAYSFGSYRERTESYDSVFQDKKRPMCSNIDFLTCPPPCLFLSAESLNIESLNINLNDYLCAERIKKPFMHGYRVVNRYARWLNNPSCASVLDYFL